MFESGVSGTTVIGEAPASADAVIAAMLDADRAVRLEQVRRFTLAASYADLHATIDEAGWWPIGGPRLIDVGGDGTPPIVDLSLLELAAALHVTSESAEMLIGDALAVRHRLPRAWEALNGLRILVWQARELARLLWELDVEDARWVDAQLDVGYGSMSWTRLVALADGLKLQRRPDLARTERDRRLAARRVTLESTRHGVTDLHAVMDTPAAALLDAQVGRLARILAEGGDTNDTDIRRATALGVLANPARALQLLQASLLDSLPLDDCPLSGQPAHTCGSVTVDPEDLLPATDLVVHLTDATARDGDGIARIDRLGPVLTAWLADLFGHHRINVRPVLDCNGLVPSDSYECPPRMREAVHLRNPHDTFPWSTRRSMRLDLDHTIPYDPDGPPGQTRPDNLAPLARRAHRAKTHAGWTVAQPLLGVFLWRSPLGRHSLVTASGTHDLGNRAEGTD